MADDLVLDVREITQFPPKVQADPTDAIVIQNGGLGGPYQMVNALGLVVGAVSDPGATIGVGLQVPANAGGGLISTNVTTPLGCTNGYNWYLNNLGQTTSLGGGPSRH